MTRHRLPALVFTALLFAMPQMAAVDFQADVRPLLADKCFQCHGPDPATRTAELRLDRREGLFQGRPNGTPVIPGNSRDSLVYQRITHANTALRMPPEYSHKSLEPEQIENIRQWIDEGAPWSGHWAFEIPKRPALPDVKNEDWCAESGRPIRSGAAGKRRDWHQHPQRIGPPWRGARRLT